MTLHWCSIKSHLIKFLSEIIFANFCCDFILETFVDLVLFLSLFYKINLVYFNIMGSKILIIEWLVQCLSL